MPGHKTVTDLNMRKQGYLLSAEAARKIGVSGESMRQWAKNEKVESFRDGYRRYVRWSSVLRHLGKTAREVRGLTQDDIWTETYPPSE